MRSLWHQSLCSSLTEVVSRTHTSLTHFHLIPWFKAKATAMGGLVRDLEEKVGMQTYTIFHQYLLWFPYATNQNRILCGGPPFDYRRSSHLKPGNCPGTQRILFSGLYSIVPLYSDLYEDIRRRETVAKYRPFVDAQEYVSQWRHQR
jgi:hypothetical protein